MTESRVYLFSALLLICMCGVVFWAIDEVEQDFSQARAQIARESFSTMVEKNQPR